MKKIVLSLVAVFGMSSFGFADENTASVEPAAEEESSKDEADGLYLGLAYTHLSHDVDSLGETIVSEMDFHAVTLQAGYKFNPYIAVEGRYVKTLGDPKDVRGLEPDDADITEWGIYLKPIYPVAPEFDIYALLGYAGTDATGSFNIGGTPTSFSVNEGGFSWGAGIEYAITEEFSVFVDYLVFYDDSSALFDKVIDSNNYGISYKF